MPKHLFLKILVAWSVAALVLLVASGKANAQQMRTWTDSTGQFTVEAKMAEFDGKNVKLEKADGRVVTLALDKLSVADQAFVRVEAARQKTAANPFEGGEPAGATANNRSVASGSTATPSGTVRRGDFSSAETIIPGVVSGWNYKPAPVTLDGEKANYLPCPIVPENNISLFESLHFAKGTDASIAVTSMDGREEKVTNVFIMNMKTGKTISAKLPYLAKVWGISPDGKRIMATSKDHTDKVAEARLDFYGITNNGLTPTSSLLPYPDGSIDIYQKVEWAVWVTPEHVLTCNYNNSVRLWDMKSGKAVYAMSIDNKFVVLSKDRKAMVVAVKSGAALCDTMTGKTLGMLSNEAPWMMKFDFSPDNTRLLGIIQKRPEGEVRFGDLLETISGNINIWDLTTGKIINEITLAPDVHDPEWVDNRMIIRGNTLYDSESGVPVCCYEGFFTKSASFNGLYCYLMGNGRGEYVLASAKLPHKAALDAVSQVKVKDRFVLYPGAEVAVKIETDGSASEQDIRMHLEQNLKESGFVVKSSAKVQFVASVKKSAEGDVTYSGENRGPFPMPPLFGRSGPQVDVKITAYESVLTISNNGVDFWKTGVLAVPKSIELDKDRSIQELADELCKPDLEFFANTNLPRYHTGERQKPSPIAPLVQSNESALIKATLTPTGVR